MDTSLLSESVANIVNVNHNNEGIKVNPNTIKYGGLIASIEGSSILNIQNLYGSNLFGGYGAFTVTDNSSLSIKDIILDNISGNKQGGVLLYSNNENELASSFNVINGTFTNFYQDYEYISSTFIFIKKNIEISLNDCKIDNLYGRNAHEYSANIELNNVSLRNHITSIPSSFIRVDSISNTERILIKTNSADINISSSSFESIRNCGYTEECLKLLKNWNSGINDSSIAEIGPESNLTIMETSFTEVLGMTGFKAEKSSVIILDSCTLVMCFFEEGMILIDTNSYKNVGHYIINGGYFLSVMGGRSTIVTIKEIDSTSSVEINFSFFDSCFSVDYGAGIVYSLSYSNSTNTNISFNEWGPSISLSMTKESEPYFSNKDDLIIENPDGFVTNPTKMILSPDSVNSTSILSGEILSETIKCKNIFNK
ncbi:hypothetical protein LY90DRAFT_511561 [Neocallimastix californiae]|uniref:Right handed beta helix domain-containing protein n=1 Tax=Neocallimastix californiae TaxID=1754190 RepID=A0A1Y2BPW7_9FUNG|nr:hypothetical protein LY90DRAFT_511561 [Neocallimastix californiae]|eukprot:ORY36215.1 hypothetical protein LY90DRAFT_511561 [Neocallimastix californiae]